MINIILITSDDKKVKLVRRNVNKVSFHAYNDLNFVNYDLKSLNKKVFETDYEKIYIIDLDCLNNSIKIAKLIRSFDLESEIIFMASKKEILDRFYGIIYNIFSYIVIDKLFSKKLIDDILFIINHKYDNDLFCFENRVIKIIINYKKILYIYRDTQRRKTVVVTDNNMYMLNIPLKDSFKYLDNRFKQSHRACIVNESRVEFFNWNVGYFELDISKKIYLLSKKYRYKLNND